jgi:chromosome partitioning protein
VWGATIIALVYRFNVVHYVFVYLSGIGAHYMILTVGNKKGGVGKTTLAINIAIALTQKGRDVLIVDAETMATNFTNLRVSLRGSAGYTAISLHGAAIRSQVRQLAQKYDDIVIDTGGEDATGSLRAALTVADMVLIPVRPRTFDTWGTGETMEFIKEAREINEKLRAVAVLNCADHQGRDNDDTLAELKTIDGLEVVPFIIGDRKAFPNAGAAGLSVLEFKGKDPKAAEELERLIAFLTTDNVYTNDIGALSYGNR